MQLINRIGLAVIGCAVALSSMAVNADVGDMDVMFLPEDDPHGSPLGSKGIGELGICGAGAAVINAIHNATGARIRDLPATPDKLLPRLEALDV